jgi:hypothetical protein
MKPSPIRPFSGSLSSSFLPNGRRAPHRLRALAGECERKIENDEFLDHPDQLCGRHHRGFDRAALHRRRDLLLAPQRPVRKDLDFHFPAALLLDQISELLRAEALRVVDRIDDRELDVALLDVLGVSNDGGQTEQ